MLLPIPKEIRDPVDTMVAPQSSAVVSVRGVPLGMRRMRPRYLDPDSCDRPVAVDVLVREEPDEEEDEEEEEEDDDEGDDQDDENDDEGYSEKPAFGREIAPGGQDRALLPTA
jgi:hypothetical protein